MLTIYRITFLLLHASADSFMERFQRSIVQTYRYRQLVRETFLTRSCRVGVSSLPLTRWRWIWRWWRLTVNCVFISNKKNWSDWEVMGIRNRLFFSLAAMALNWVQNHCKRSSGFLLYLYVSLIWERTESQREQIHNFAFYCFGE